MARSGVGPPWRHGLHAPARACPHDPSEQQHRPEEGALAGHGRPSTHPEGATNPAPRPSRWDEARLTVKNSSMTLPSSSVARHDSVGFSSTFWEDSNMAM